MARANVLRSDTIAGISVACAHVASCMETLSLCTAVKGGELRESAFITQARVLRMMYHELWSTRNPSAIIHVC